MLIPIKKALSSPGFLLRFHAENANQQKASKNEQAETNRLPRWDRRWFVFNGTSPNHERRVATQNCEKMDWNAEYMDSSERFIGLLNPFCTPTQLRTNSTRTERKNQLLSLFVAGSDVIIARSTWLTDSADLNTVATSASRQTINWSCPSLSAKQLGFALL